MVLRILSSPGWITIFGSTNFIFFLLFFSGSVIAGFVFNGSVRQGVRGVMTAVGNVNNTLVDTQAKVV